MRTEEVNHHVTHVMIMSPEDLQALWDQLRAEAISDSDRQEIDDLFSRQLP